MQRELLIIHDQHRNAGIIVDIVNDTLNLVPVTASNAASDAGRNAHDVIIIEYGIDPQQVERLPQIVVGGQIKRPINRGGKLRKQITDFQLLALVSKIWMLPIHSVTGSFALWRHFST